MLTGESTPVGKTAVESSEGDEIYDPAKHSKFTLYAGTQLLQSKCFQYSSVRRARQMSLQQWLIKLAIKKAIGMVIRTGFSTTKGSLVRSILYSRPIQFKFYSDSFKFIGFLFIISTLFRVLNATRAIDKADSLSHTNIRVATAAFVLSSFRFRELGFSWGGLILKGLDLYTIAIPPALPIVLTIGVVFAVDRLSRSGISCIAPSRFVSASLCEHKTSDLSH